MHCTLINTIYRRPRADIRTPFSYPSILASTTLRQYLLQQSDTETGTRRTVGVDLGVWDVNELQICEMGSWGPEGEYVAVARCSLS